ncbi:glycosyltransferase family 61 protein [Desulfovibrio inopinatus]|uniref:glycosyltransferase family 61 protein n=1 Tax=Desulfovibrio inopinatus TaxID=102109 RepID=UPI00042A8CB6|nr:glycosyltransferase 61 family protein [Desulfovibrio inopinatus]
MIRKWYFAFNQDMIATYAATIRSAVHSCLKFTNLVPHCLYHGERSAFIDELTEAGVVVLDYKPSYFQIANWMEHGINPANPLLLRSDISLMEQEDEFVLYSDIGVLFLKEASFDAVTPQYIAMAPSLERDSAHTTSSGVMVINVPAVRATRDDFYRYLAACLPALSAPGADPMASYYQGVCEELPHTFAWKPYWGIEPKAKIIHFHRPTPTEAEEALHNIKESPDGQFAQYILRSTEAYELYLRKYNEITRDADRRFKRAIMPVGQLIGVVNNCAHIIIRRSNTAIRQVTVDVFADEVLVNRKFIPFSPNQNAIDTVIPINPTAALTTKTRIDVRFSFCQHSFQKSPVTVEPLLGSKQPPLVSGPIHSVSITDDIPLLDDVQKGSIPARDFNNQVFLDTPTLDANPLPLSQVPIVNYRAPETHCRKLQNAFVCMPDGVVFLENASLVRETCYFEQAFNSLRIGKVSHWGNDFYYIKEIGHGPDIETPVALLATPVSSTSYSHFLAYCLPNILVLRDTVARTGAKYLTPALEDWQFDLLNLAGIQEEDLLIWPHLAVSRVNELYIASSLLKTPMGPHPALGWIFQEMIKRSSTTNSASTHSDRSLVYLKRFGEISQFSNEAEVIRRLQEAGFYILDPLESTVHEIIQTIHNARFIVGAHTDSLVNILFGSPGCQVLHIGLRQLRLPQAASFAAIQGLRYAYIEATPSKEESGHFSVSIDDLLHTIDAMLRTRSLTTNIHLKMDA